MEAAYLSLIYMNCAVSCDQVPHCPTKMCDSHYHFLCCNCGEQSIVESKVRVCRYTPQMFTYCLKPGCIQKACESTFDNEDPDPHQDPEMYGQQEDNVEYGREFDD